MLRIGVRGVEGGNGIGPEAVQRLRETLIVGNVIDLGLVTDQGIAHTTEGLVIGHGSVSMIESRLVCHQGAETGLRKEIVTGIEKETTGTSRRRSGEATITIGREIEKKTETGDETIDTVKDSTTEIAGIEIPHGSIGIAIIATESAALTDQRLMTGAMRASVLSVTAHRNLFFNVATVILIA